MTIVLLSCGCKKDYTTTPEAGEEVICRSHDIVRVMAEDAVLRCLDCDYYREYDSLATYRICTTATKHARNKGHRILHYNPIDGPGTMCLHESPIAPVFTFGRPPF